MALKEKIAIKSQSRIEVKLRPLKPEDHERVSFWLMQPFIIERSFVVPAPRCIPKDFFTKKYAYRCMDLLLDDLTHRSFAIIYNKKHVGNVGFKNVDLEQKKAECFIEIGDKRSRQKGVAQKAMELLLAFGVRVLKLKMVELEVLEFNVAAIKIYKKLGFQSLNSCLWHYDEFGIYWKVLRMRLKL
ncbi:MAG: GNAT family N-acetyltransferase [Myxococcales bacterium]|nr:GNAT family N-acetyltransferase [Myxococcales bacterium]USN50339.1 MAG: GNAT family N-acetyltransferase [Myxococcales bacterium]